ncbi:MAG: hypothetical protein LBD59_03660 [Prevotellaceae bacterium]|nr:hypothetical protein [Prevotellaceae bacterium]
MRAVVSCFQSENPALRQSVAISFRQGQRNPDIYGDGKSTIKRRRQHTNYKAIN